MTFTTRPATASDHGTFARLFPELKVPDPVPTAEHFAATMLPRVLILCDGTEPIGYTFWNLYGTTAHVVHVAVDPRARGRGAGRALMDALRKTLVGCTRWYLNVKRDNAPALALYTRCGFTIEHESWAMRLTWAQIANLPTDASAVAATATPPDDEAIAGRFTLDRERIAMLRNKPATVLMTLREGASTTLVAFAAFDPTFPGFYPFRVTRPTLARPLFEACRPHADQRFNYVNINVEADPALRDTLTTAGATLHFALVQMGAPLA